MRIAIEFDDERETEVIENVTQYALVGVCNRQGIAPAVFRQSMIGDANELLGLLLSVGEDIKDFKNGRS